MNDQSVFRPIAISLNTIEDTHGPYGGREASEDLFVGRKVIIDKIVDLLESSRRRGSYLIAGYRGAGKTSVIDRAITQYHKGKKQSLLDVRINLGDNSQLTPLNIFYSIANILRDQMLNKDRSKLERFLEYSVAPRNIGIVIFILLAPVLPVAWFKPEFLPLYNYAIWLIYIFILLKGAAWAVSQYRHPELKQIKDLDDLIERMSNEISEGRTAKINQRNFGFEDARHKKKLPINAREAEELLFNILERIQDRKSKTFVERILSIKRKPGTARKVVIVLDEIDKLSNNEEFSEMHHHARSDDQEFGKINKINTLLGSLKNFINTAEATFFFISGRETLDRYYSEKGSSNSLYESLFDRVFEVPSFLTDQGERLRGTQLSTLIEEYLCRRIRIKRDETYEKKDKFEYYSLNKYSASFPQDTADDIIIRRGINTLRTFIHYLTFHSWGNPKKLSSIFESFIVLDEQIKEARKEGSILVLNEGNVEASHWLVFNANHQRSFSLASEITTLFQHQLSREVSKISDKLTVSTLSSLHFILKLHSFGFTRESLHRMSEAINVYRSPELNTIIDDLLTQVFKSYIRRVRNGIYRYRFNSGFEQELRYISHVSELESATYNFSLDSMRHVKRFFENIIRENANDTIAVAKTNITLGDMCAMEQSYTAASVHYSTASHILEEVLNKSKIPINQEILMQYIEAMIKHGDLEERRQNYNHAAAIYFTADKVVEKFSHKEFLHLKNGDSKWDLLKQPFWALHFLSLKRSPTNINVELPSHLYPGEDSKFHYRTATLYFFRGKMNRAMYLYEKVLYAARKKHNEYLSFFDERDAYLSGKAQVGLVESQLINQSRVLFDKAKTTSSEDGRVGEKDFNEKLLEALLKHSIETYIGVPLVRAAALFEQNYLYISATMTHIKAISYFTTILDAFDHSTFSEDKNVTNQEAQLALTEKIYELILARGADAIRCIDKARQLETSHSNKTLLIYDLTRRHDTHEMNITKLFDILLRPDTIGDYPVNEALFWQNSLWAHKLVATLCWAHYVKHKIEMEPKLYKVHKNIPGYLPGIVTGSGFSIRPAILLRWVCARDLNRQFIEKKLLILDGEGCNVEKALKNCTHIRLASAGEEIISNLILDQYKDQDKDSVVKNAYLISRYLYFAQESSRIISRKNLDLIFPRLPQLYFAQWKLLLNLLSTMLAARDKILEHTKEQLHSVRDYSFLLQRRLVALDQKLAPQERIAPSHFDYEFIFLRLNESLESSISLVDRTSRAHKGIFQHKYFCHDDLSDPDFCTDYTLAYMFTPRARYLHKEVEKTHKAFKEKLEKLLCPNSTENVISQL